MKKTKLVIEYEYEFDLLGIISSVKFYKLAWYINKHLKIRFKKEEDLKLNVTGNRSSYFGNYLFETENNDVWLYKNKSVDGEASFLIPEMQHFDYLIKSDKESQTFACEEILKGLKEVPWIEYIANIEVNKLKSKDNLLT